MSRAQRPMKHFTSHDDQDLKDLVYGEQITSCRKFVKEGERTYEDVSITKSWTPSED